MSRARQVEVLVAGAGPTGLMLALWLLRSGVRVRVVDAKAAPVTETRAIVVQARTLEFYDQLGLGRAALARGRHFDRVSLWNGDRLAGHIRLRGVGEALTPHPYAYILTQDQNEALLVEAVQAAGGHIEWNTELVDLSQADDAARSVRVTLQSTTSRAPEVVEAAWVAGCDGARSRVRHALGVQFTGGTYDHTFFVADVTASGKVVEGDVNIDLEDWQFVAWFPMPGERRFRVVGLLPEGANLELGFEAVRANVERAGLARVQDVHWFSTYRVHHRVADRFRVGRVFLLGDAAHVHSPVGGQGMNTGLGDAVNLAWKLAQTVRGGSEELLDTYDAERRPFARMLVHTTDRAFQVIVSPTELARFVRTQVVPRVMPAATRFTAVRRLLFRFVSQTRLGYRDSPLSEGEVGRISAGDRLPWIAASRGDGGEPASNFEPLRSLSWQLHVYGRASPELAAWCEARQVPLHQFAYGDAARHAGVVEDATYLIRPDGHVGLVSESFDEARHDLYAKRWLPAARPSERRAPWSTFAPSAAPR